MANESPRDGTLTYYRKRISMSEKLDASEIRAQQKTVAVKRGEAHAIPDAHVRTATTTQYFASQYALLSFHVTSRVSGPTL